MKSENKPGSGWRWIMCQKWDMWESDFIKPEKIGSWNTSISKQHLVWFKQITDSTHYKQ